jgi:hypothetical protein
MESSVASGGANRGAFSLLHDKRLPCQVCALCGTMDLFVAADDDRGLSIYRTISWQRTLTLGAGDLGNLVGKQITAMAWSPDGRTIALGMAGRGLVLRTVENGREIILPGGDRGATKDVRLIEWRAQQPMHKKGRQVQDSAEGEVDGDDDDNERVAVLRRALGAGWARMGKVDADPDPSIDPNAEGALVEKEFLESICARELSVLTMVDSSGHISLHLNGTYQLLELDLESPVMRCVLSPDLTLLLAVSIPPPPLPPRLVRVRLDDLWSLRHSLKSLTAAHAQFASVERDIRAAAAAARKAWSDAQAALGKKMVGLSKLLNDYGVTNSSPRDEFLNMVTCGLLSPAMTQFLSHDFSIGILLRLLKTIDSGIGAAEVAVRVGIGGGVRGMLEIACDVRALALLPSIECGEGLDIGDAPSELLVRQAQRLVLASEELLKEIHRTRTSISHFFHWLTTVARRTTATPTAGEPPPPSPSTTVMKVVLEVLTAPEIPQHWARAAGGKDGVAILEAERLFCSRVMNLLSPNGTDENPAEDGESASSGVSFPRNEPFIHCLDQAHAAAAAVFATPKLPQFLSGDATMTNPLSGLALCSSVGNAVIAPHFRERLAVSEGVDLDNVTVLAAVGQENLIRILLLVCGGAHAGQIWTTSVVFTSEEATLTVTQLEFYGPCPQGRKERLVVLIKSLGSGGDGGSWTIGSMAYDDLPFSSIGPLQEGADLFAAATQAGQQPIPILVNPTEDGNGLIRFRILPDDFVAPHMAVSGMRGTACVWGGSSRFLVLDMEEEDEEIEEEEEEDDDEDMSDS